MNLRSLLEHSLLVNSTLDTVTQRYAVFSIQYSAVQYSTDLLVPAIPYSSNLINVTVWKVIHCHGRANVQVQEVSGRGVDSSKSGFRATRAGPFT